MVSLELRARCTAAAALAADFRAEVTRQPATWQPDGEWAYRLAEVRAVLDTALGDEHRDRQRALEEIDAIVNGGDGR
jgi:hypothetical protein